MYYKVLARMFAQIDPDYLFNEEIAPLVIRYEGRKFTDNKRDYGGPTKFGWTLRTYRELINPSATKNTIKRLTEVEAMHDYRVYFWDDNRDSDLESFQLAAVLFLAQINLGPSRPNNILKKVVNASCSSNMRYNGHISQEDINLINACDYISEKFQLKLHKFYSTNEAIKDSWAWAKDGLTKRIFLR